MLEFVALDLDPDFRDFNICSLWDPLLKPGGGPSESALFELAYLARQGDRIALVEYVDTLDWTLRVESFECFQRIHGPRPNRYEHWLYSKLQQLLGVFWYEDLRVYGLGEFGDAGAPLTDRPWEEGSGVLTGTQAAIQDDDLARAFSPEDCAEFDWMSLLRKLLSVGKNRLAEFDRTVDERIRQKSKTGVHAPPTDRQERRKHWTRNEE